MALSKELEDALNEALENLTDTYVRQLVASFIISEATPDHAMGVEDNKIVSHAESGRKFQVSLVAHVEEVDPFGLPPDATMN